MKWKNLVKDYFIFTKKDRIGMAVICLLISLVFILPVLFRNFKQVNTQPLNNNLQPIIQNLKTKNKQAYNKTPYSKNDYSNYQSDGEVNYTERKKTSSNLFYFDPNTLSLAGWKKLGIRDKTITTIQKYIAKGGRFKTANDLQKIYGLFPNEYERIKPFVQITSDEAAPFTKQETPTPIYENKLPNKRDALININFADTTQLKYLQGIGSKLAARIINYRNSLGGFYSLSQIGETYGISDSLFQIIKPRFNLAENSFIKLNINVATVDELKKHPYIKQNFAKLIIAYRDAHGSYKSVEEITKILSIPNDAFLKMKPYLKTDD